MDLLGHGRIWPGGRTVIRGELKGQPRRGVAGGHDHPVVAAVRDRLPEQLGVERRQGGRVRAVEHDVMQSSEHAVSMTRGPDQMMPSSGRGIDAANRSALSLTTSMTGGRSR